MKLGNAPESAAVEVGLRPPMTRLQGSGDQGPDRNRNEGSDNMGISVRQADETLAVAIPGITEQEQIRRIRSILQDGDLVGAYRMARNAIEALGETEKLQAMADAMKRRLRAQIRVAVRAARHTDAIPLAEALLDDPELGAEATESLILSARQSTNDGQLAMLLADITDREACNLRLWQALANFVAALPAEPRFIEKGFEVLEHLPGNVRAIAGLTDLLRRYDAE